MVDASFQWKSKAVSHVGKVRQHNEDSVLDKPAQGLWVVADGMGGHEAGDIASQMIVNTLDQLSPRAYISDYIDLVDDTLVRINQDLLDYSQKKLNGLTVGSTAVCMITRGQLGVVLWVGDSRLYRLREDHLVQLTKDHSEVQRLVDEGVITAEQAENSAFKNVLTRALGAHEVVDIDINAFDIAAGDRFLLCSDGLYNELTEQEINTLIRARPFDQVADVFTNKILNTPARDNFSFIVIEPF
ncbi:MAG: serine/threonine-protein phosphatase [Hahellaceae bacterium]|jgi:serine/threonine protein phosphatase PrpC|nr:serine/threonine-protein phosphatase [Hahellaceae bacterium]MCP5210445.1 serine/threonine-protein phosphatase [Hahellaceae bacterium]